MDANMIADLKQFMSDTIRQELSGLATKEDLARLEVKIESEIGRLEVKVESEIARLEGKIDELSHGVGEALRISNNAIEELPAEKLTDHVRQYHHA